MALSSPCIHIPDGLEYDTNQFLVPECYKSDLKGVMISEGMIKDRIKKLAHEIHETIGDQHLTLICVLKGSYRFFTELVNELATARSKCLTQISIDFIRAVSYENTESTGRLRLIGLTNMSELHDQNVLIIDDIVDTGLTLSRLVATIYDEGAKKVWTSVLLSKRITRRETVEEHFVAFSIPNTFCVGFGLDYSQKFRDLGPICSMSQAGIDKYRSD